MYTKQSDLGLHCLQFHLHLLNSKCIIKQIVLVILGIPNFSQQLESRLIYASCFNNLHEGILRKQLTKVFLVIIIIWFTSSLSYIVKQMYYIKNRLQGLMLFLLLRITILYSQRTLCLDSDSVSLMKKTYIFFFWEA